MCPAGRAAELSWRGFVSRNPGPEVGSSWLGQRDPEQRGTGWGTGGRESLELLAQGGWVVVVWEWEGEGERGRCPERGGIWREMTESNGGGGSGEEGRRGGGGREGAAGSRVAPPGRRRVQGKVRGGEAMGYKAEGGGCGEGDSEGSGARDGCRCRRGVQKGGLKGARGRVPGARVGAGVHGRGGAGRSPTFVHAGVRVLEHRQLVNAAELFEQRLEVLLVQVARDLAHEELDGVQVLHAVGPRPGALRPAAAHRPGPGRSCGAAAALLGQRPRPRDYTTAPLAAAAGTAGGGRRGPRETEAQRSRRCGGLQAGRAIRKTDGLARVLASLMCLAPTAMRSVPQPHALGRLSRTSGVPG